ncbi:hypothetical protein N431DRAFT_463301 [Stipitochalara longipes BDJ]|nr:hypothetical protein N431DRAFT_463301 [Stipitochalara longipes BDJ]
MSSFPPSPPPPRPPSYQSPASLATPPRNPTSWFSLTVTLHAVPTQLVPPKVSDPRSTGATAAADANKRPIHHPDASLLHKADVPRLVVPHLNLDEEKQRNQWIKNESRVDYLHWEERCGRGTAWQTHTCMYGRCATALQALLQEKVL